jgi:hypothetical protein
MTLEGGDFTWELEYDGPITWPLEKERQEGYVFDHLGSIDKPMVGGGARLSPPRKRHGVAHV